MKITLYRGISVRPEDVNEVREDLFSNGIVDDTKNSMWHFLGRDLRENLLTLMNCNELTTGHTRLPTKEKRTDSGGMIRVPIGGFPLVCACGDEYGAKFYATKHNINEEIGKTCGLVIKFQANIEDIYIDGRDFLYTAFQFAEVDEQKQYVAILFGNRILQYLEKAMVSSDQNHRIALCDLAVQDMDVINFHTSNQHPINGRYGTFFKSAFHVRLPIAKNEIIDIYEVHPESWSAEYSIDGFRRLSDEEVIRNISNLRVLAGKGDEKATFQLGEAYLRGDGVLRSSSLAIHYFSESFNLGNDDAGYIISEMYRHGTGVPIDYENCLEWLVKVAKRNSLFFLEIGRMFEKGELGEKSLVEAYKWYTIGMTRGSDYSKSCFINALDEIKRKMSEGDGLNGEFMARNWINL